MLWAMATERKASAALEAFIDKTIELAKERGYNPTVFRGMRAQHGPSKPSKSWSKAVTCKAVSSGSNSLGC